MAADPLTDAVVARRLLERAVLYDQKPVLTTEEIDDLMLVATSQDDDDADQWTDADLNGAASLGWQWKAGKVAGNFTVGLKDGVKFNREQVHAHCLQMAADYLLGEASVLGTPRRRSGLASIRLVTDRYTAETDTGTVN